MKKSLWISVLALALAGIIVLSALVIQKYNKRKLLQERIYKLPEFEYLTPEKLVFRSSDISRGPLVIMHVHPECEHCQYEIMQLNMHKELFSGVKLILISASDRESTASFIRDYKISLSEDLIALVDSTDNFSEIFGNYPFPSHFLYNRDLELIKILQGEFRYETILKFLHANEH